jgi:magnesium transporter
MSMVVACAGYQDGRRVANLDVARCGSFLDGAGRFVWIGLYEPSEELLRTVQRQFGLHDLAVEDAFRAHQRPKVDVYGDAIFMVLRTARLIDAEIEFGETHVFAGKGYIISVRHGATSSYKEVRDRCESTPRMLENGEDYVLYAIMDFVVDNYMPIVDAIQYMPIVDAIQRQVEEIEDAVQQGAGTLGSNTIRRIAALRRDLLMGQRILSESGRSTKNPDRPPRAGARRRRRGDRGVGRRDE